ncbi:uncharacterized protein BXZ73DRAFT_97613 [Epithele typhae]|uniref:uncharacterized protein n=1 Tax=Epithele typhae TaxID=378194 RepID=UPI00200738B0|nr:uncharacterized protein BXZ73DRAFT_97613 [Epithele typhae]KAH9942194.1 hypothetical protein BXZ73DRAFT_97613 [Epithele typhae]
MASISSSHQVTDPFYGHEEIAKLCARFVKYLFACPDLPPLSTFILPAVPLPLANFIAYTLHRTRLHTSVTFVALYLLRRLKARVPPMNKVICDDTYSNKSWVIVGKDMFPCEQLNKMEREFCFFLKWHLNVEPSALQEFAHNVWRDFQGRGPCPYVYVPPSAPSSAMSPITPYTAASAPHASRGQATLR